MRPNKKILEKFWKIPDELSCSSCRLKRTASLTFRMRPDQIRRYRLIILLTSEIKTSDNVEDRREKW